jgi:hypothetical protein
MSEAEDVPPIEAADPELRQLLGMFDVPAFARRGQDLEYAIQRLHDRLRRQRDEMLEMVRLRLRQWAAAVEGPDAWPGCFASPIEGLWPEAAAPPPVWNTNPAPPRRRRAIARDLIASIERFNRRWTALIDGLNLEPINTMIDQYNRYYVLEKECVLRSPRLATRHFAPRPLVDRSDLLRVYPPLSLPASPRK